MPVSAQAPARELELLPATVTSSSISSADHSSEKVIELAGNSEAVEPNKFDTKVEVIDEKVLGDVEDDSDWEHDADHPRNWTSGRKWTAVAIVGLYSFMGPLSSSMMAPGLSQVAQRYNIVNETILALTLSIFLISFALGPLILSPLSEMYGRTWILHISNIFNIVFNIGCAFSPNTTCLLMMRFLTGFSSSAPMALGGGSISDLFSEKDRASAMSIYTLAPLLGPSVGPIAGGYITQTLGIKWTFIIIAISCGFTSVLGIPLLRETYAPVVRWRRAKKEGDLEKASRLEPSVLAAHGGTKSQIIWTNLSRPIVLLTRSYVCFILSLFQAFNYGIYYIMFATFARFFKDTYGFGPGLGGLTYLGLGFGFMTATFLGARFFDKLYMALSARNGGKGTPEMRMPALMIGSVMCPVGLLWYGWSAQAQLHYMMPIIGTAIYGFGVLAVYLPIQLYLVDAFTFAASVTGAASVFRSILGFAFPLFGQRMVDKLGYGGSNTLLAGIAVAIGIPFPVYIYYRGAGIRARSPYTR